MSQWYLSDNDPATWTWVHCRMPSCGHTRAMPLAPWRIRWGVKNPTPLMRQYFRCGSCGRKGCEFTAQRIGTGANGVNIGYKEEYPHGQELRIRGERQWPETYPDAEERAIREYKARFLCGDAIKTADCMCNLYALKAGQRHIADTARAIRDMTGNMPPYPAIFPNRIAPVVRVAPDGVRELINMRWGFPPPNIPGSKPRNPYLTNVRNVDSRYWQTYLKKPEHRCLVPVTSFAEPDNRGLAEPNSKNPRTIWTWFARDDLRPVFFFAGIWREFEGDRGTKKEPNVGRHLVFAFLTTDASPDVAAIHPDATPVMLFDEAAREQWLNAPWEIARDLQKPPPAGALKIVATDRKDDPA